MRKYLFYISQNYSFSILRPIQEVIRKEGGEVRWFFEGNAVNPNYLKGNEIRLDSVPAIFDFKPDVTLATANSIPSFLPGLKTCVFHGFDAGKKKRNGEVDHFLIRGCFDLYCTQGPSTTRVFMQRQQELGFFNVIETGWPALDPLFPLAQPAPSSKPRILFCSTFSKRLSAAPLLLSTIEEMSQRGNYQWKVQFHPKMPREVVEGYRRIQNENLEFVETDDIIPLLKEADVMLSDTSSVIFMFLIQRKPVVTFRNIAPAPYLINITNEKNIEQALEQALKPSTELMAAIEHQALELHPYKDGKSAERVIEAIDDCLSGKYPLPRNRPLNLIRNLKYRKKLGYWKL